jgi:hypothetical protein
MVALHSVHRQRITGYILSTMGIVYVHEIDGTLNHRKWPPKYLQTLEIPHYL